MNRTTAEAPTGAVLFIVGMRVNQWWAVHRWLPVAIAMPRMLAELAGSQGRGLLGKPRTFVSGRIVMVQQYWRSYDELESYAGSASGRHAPAWRAFNRKARGNASVGIFHETYVIEAGSYENIYVNVPQSILLASAFGATPVAAGGNSSRQRLSRA
jgi:hypothetical protein